MKVGILSVCIPDNICRLFITSERAMYYSYFILPSKQMTVEQEEAVMHTERGAYCMAHNGWVMGE